MMGRRGGAAMIGLIFMVLSILLLLALGSTQFGATDLNLAMAQVHSTQALYTAEAGLAAALHAIDSQEDLIPAGDFVNHPLHQGSEDRYTVTMTKGPATAPNGTEVPAGTDYLLSTGVTARGTRRSIGVLISRSEALFKQGILADNVSLVDSQVDAFDSRTGPYRDAASRIYGEDLISTNSVGFHDIKLETSSRIFGRVNVGPGGDPNHVIDNPSKADEVSVLSEPMKVYYEPPPPANKLAPILVFTRDDTLPPGRYKSVTIRDGARVTFQPGGYTIGELHIRDAGKLVVAPNASASNSVRLGIDKEMKITDDDSILNSTHIASSLRIRFRGLGQLTMRGGSEAYFVLRARGATVVLRSPITGSTTEAFGAIYASRVELNGSQFHFDVALRESGVYKGSILVLGRQVF